MLKTLRLCSRIGVLASQKTSKIDQNHEQNHFKISVCKNSASEDDFLTLKACRGSSGRLWDDFGWILGSFWGSKRGQNRKGPLNTARFGAKRVLEGSRGRFLVDFGRLGVVF